MGMYSLKKNDMKILQITKKAPFPMKDGESIAVSTLSIGLSEANHEVTVLVMSSPKHPFDVQNVPENVKKNIKFESAFVDSSHSILKFFFNLFSPLPYHVQRFQSEEFRTLLSRILMENSFDIIQLEGMALLQWIPLIRLHTKGKIVFRAHNIESEIWLRQADSEKSWIKKWVLRNVGLKTRDYEFSKSSDADAVIAISQRDLDQFNKCSNIQNGFVVSAAMIQFTQCQVNITPNVCYLGALDWIPNVEGLKWFVIEVLPLLRKKIQDFRVHIAGRNASQDFIKWLEVHHVTYHGEVPDANQFLCDFGVVILPLLAGSGMRIKAIEAMSAGKCIVSTGIGMEGINVKDGIHFLQADNASTFAEKILTLINQPELQVNMASAAKEFADNTFGYRKVAKDLESCYYQILSH